MCGLTGIVDPKRRFGAAETRTMALAQAHRGPDDHADWSDPVLPVSFSFLRLAILDLSADGNQPMHDGPLTLVYNGEIYNYRELRAQLESQHGSVFRSTSDTEVLLKGFLIWGVAETLAKVNGMYGLSLLDQAIAYGGGRLDEAVVRAMLGSVDRRHAAALVQALAANDGRAPDLGPTVGGALVGAAQAVA